MIRIADLRCATCGSAEVVCIAPGSEEIRDLFLLVKQTPARAVCLEHWPVKAAVEAK